MPYINSPRFLRTGVVTTPKLASGSVTEPKVAYTSVTVTVNATASTGSSAANPALVGGTILGFHPAGNQDVFVDNVVLNGDGSVTVTLGAAAVANNVFRVVVLRAA